MKSEQKDSRFETIKNVKKKIEREIISDENIISIGIVKETNELGQETEDYVIQIGLRSKKDTVAVDRLQTKVKALLEEFGASLKPLSDDPIKINFVEEEQAYALSRLELPIATVSIIPFFGENKHHSVRGRKETTALQSGPFDGSIFPDRLSVVKTSMNHAGFFANGKRRNYSTMTHRGLIKPNSTTSLSLAKPVIQLLRMAFK